jgi:hypothetical protein
LTDPCVAPRARRADLPRSIARFEVEETWLRFGMDRPRDALVHSRINAINKSWMPLLHNGPRLRATAWKPGTFPDLIDAARIAAITLDQIPAANPQPPRQPDIDGIGFGQASVTAGTIGLRL